MLPLQNTVRETIQKEGEEGGYGLEEHQLLTTAAEERQMVPEYTAEHPNDHEGSPEPSTINFNKGKKVRQNGGPVQEYQAIVFILDDGQHLGT